MCEKRSKIVKTVKQYSLLGTVYSIQYSVAHFCVAIFVWLRRTLEIVCFIWMWRKLCSIILYIQWIWCDESTKRMKFHFIFLFFLFLVVLVNFTVHSLTKLIWFDLIISLCEPVVKNTFDSFIYSLSSFANPKRASEFNTK